MRSSSLWLAAPAAHLLVPRQGVRSGQLLRMGHEA